MIISEHQREALEEMGTRPEDLVWFQIKDDSLLPWIKPGVWVIIDRAKANIESGELYALVMNKTIVPRRVYIENNIYRIVCDNPNLKAKTSDYPVANLDNIQVIGKLVWQSGKL